jgi:hypothetical protein
MSSLFLSGILTTADKPFSNKRYLKATKRKERYCAGRRENDRNRQKTINV